MNTDEKIICASCGAEMVKPFYEGLLVEREKENGIENFNIEKCSKYIDEHTKNGILHCNFDDEDSPVYRTIALELCKSCYRQGKSNGIIFNVDGVEYVPLW